MKKLFFITFVLTILSCSEDPIIHTLFTSSNPINGGSVSSSKADIIVSLVAHKEFLNLEISDNKILLDFLVINKKMDLIKVINSVLENNGLSPVKSINESDNLKDDMFFDSFMLAELTVEIEELTGIDIFENDIITTIGEIKKVLNG